MNKPHRHKDLIIAWANGEEIQVRNGDEQEWADIESPSFVDGCEYRIKPEKEYPKSSLTDDDLANILRNGVGNDITIARAIADEAVMQYVKENEE